MYGPFIKFDGSLEMISPYDAIMMVAQASVLLRVCQRTVPELVRLFAERESAGTAAGSLDELYRSLPSADLSHDVLTKSTTSLAVARVPSCGWSDLGSPARLYAYQGRQPGIARMPAGAPTRSSQGDLAATA